MEEPSTLRALIKTYLLHNGWKNDVSSNCEEPDDFWYHPTLGVRPFETAVVWQMTQEGAYGDRCSGWREGPRIPVPVRAAETEPATYVGV
jgi:hypothetical protein